MMEKILSEMPHASFEDDPIECANCGAQIEGLDERIEKLKNQEMRNKISKIAFLASYTGRVGTICPNCESKLIINTDKKKSKVIKKIDDDIQTLLDKFDEAEEERKGKNFVQHLSDQNLANLILPPELEEEQKSNSFIIKKEKKEWKTFTDYLSS